MAGLKELRTRLESARSTQQLTSAMKMVSVSKLRKAQQKTAHVRALCFRLLELYRNVADSADCTEHNCLLQQGHGKVSRALVIVLASDKGMCGSFNSNVCKEAEQYIQRTYGHLPPQDVEVLPVGNRAVAYFAGKDHVISEIPGFSPTDAEYGDVAAFMRQVSEQYHQGVFHRVDLVCEKPVNAATQVVKARQVLPIDYILDAGVRLLDEERRKAASAAALEDASSAVDFGLHFSNKVDILPDARMVIDTMLPMVSVLYFYLVLCQSLVAEHGARMTAMSKASENADALIKELNLKYNKLRQSAITNELLEIVSGANALAEDA
ncbi:MAG: ATP synthase F1 subunit gamma [Bacteroides sp.]|nr:ATP synthase F1 subunit gamma [Ruminococcus flavefaciens]MCM1554484.1 ATP synthase F1 subunit gamma [Bacteroides sp.]